jgi:hypothetical protein
MTANAVICSRIMKSIIDVWLATNTCHVGIELQWALITNQLLTLEEISNICGLHNSFR